jgi:hypothetical protein
LKSKEGRGLVLSLREVNRLKLIRQVMEGKDGLDALGASGVRAAVKFDNCWSRHFVCKEEEEEEEMWGTLKVGLNCEKMVWVGSTTPF